MPTIDVSKNICDDCIKRLRDAASFKQQVLDCEQKFLEYYKNEQALKVKKEITYNYEKDDNNDKDIEEDGGSVLDEFCKDDKECTPKDPDKSSVNEISSDLEMDDIEKSSETDNECKSEDPDTSSVNDESEQTEAVIQNPENTEDKEVKKSVRKKMRKTIKGKVQKNVKKERKMKTFPKIECVIDTDKGKVYKCNNCGNTFCSRNSLRTHIHRLHYRTYKCKVCDVSFHKAKYIAHKKIHPIRWPCQYCPKTYNTSWTCKQHENTHTQEVQYQCDICKKFFAHKLTLARHILRHSGRHKKFVCDYCGRVFNNVSYMNMHVLSIHKKLKSFKCTFCPKAFTSNKALKVHTRNHTGERPYSCDVCLASFKSWLLLNRHKGSCQPGNPKPRLSYSCNICSERFDERNQLHSHMRTHVGSKEFRCHVCARNFYSNYSLRRHIDWHKGIKRFSCEICNKKFAQKSELLRHNRRIHDPNNIIREKVKCDVCNLYFKNLPNHMKSHNERPFACKVCKKCYPDRSTLNRHMKYVHKNIKDHVCAICNKQYVQIGTLRRHMLKVHKDMKQEET
ncbi:uncharacterized protein [Epargyreus clarus]|uniref:uncharacterized protein n=1 Tax=Epargyreus clarus TaxID=520877 RepID=UPI003C2DD8E7